MIENVRLVKLINGEEFVAQVTENDTHYICKDPVGIAPTKQGDGTMSVGFFPFMPYSEDGDFEFRKEVVIIVVTVQGDVKNNYSKIFGSIELPPSQKIIV
jgi:hypothetical protein